MNEGRKNWMREGMNERTYKGMNEEVKERTKERQKNERTNERRDEWTSSLFRFWHGHVPENSEHKRISSNEGPFRRTFPIRRATTSWENMNRKWQVIIKYVRYFKRSLDKWPNASLYARTRFSAYTATQRTFTDGFKHLRIWRLESLSSDDCWRECLHFVSTLTTRSSPNSKKPIGKAGTTNVREWIWAPVT